MWLTRAQALTALTIDLYQETSGAYRDRPRGAPAAVDALNEAHYPIADAPAPSGNGVMALNLLRLAVLTNDDDHRTRAEQLLNAFAGSAARMTTSSATYVRAADWLTGALTTVVVVGRGAAAEDVLFQAALRRARPRTVVRYFTAGSIVAEQVAPELRAMLTGDAERAYVCAGRTCAAPVSDAESLDDLLTNFRGE